MSNRGGASGLCPVPDELARTVEAAVPYAGRALPLACYSFAYPLAEPSAR